KEHAIPPNVGGDVGHGDQIPCVDLGFSAGYLCRPWQQSLLGRPRKRCPQDSGRQGTEVQSRWGRESAKDLIRDRWQKLYTISPHFPSSEGRFVAQVLSSPSRKE